MSTSGRIEVICFMFNLISMSVLSTIMIAHRWLTGRSVLIHLQTIKMGLKRGLGQPRLKHTFRENLIPARYSIPVVLQYTGGANYFIVHRAPIGWSESEKLPWRWWSFGSMVDFWRTSEHAQVTKSGISTRSRISSRSLCEVKRASATLRGDKAGGSQTHSRTQLLQGM